MIMQSHNQKQQKRRNSEEIVVSNMILEQPTDPKNSKVTLILDPRDTNLGGQGQKFCEKNSETQEFQQDQKPQTNDYSIINDPKFQAQLDKLISQRCTIAVKKSLENEITPNHLQRKRERKKSLKQSQKMETLLKKEQESSSSDNTESEKKESIKETEQSKIRHLEIMSNLDQVNFDEFVNGNDLEGKFLVLRNPTFQQYKQYKCQQHIDNLLYFDRFKNQSSAQLDSLANHKVFAMILQLSPKLFSDFYQYLEEPIDPIKKRKNNKQIFFRKAIKPDENGEYFNLSTHQVLIRNFHHGFKGKKIEERKQGILFVFSVNDRNPAYYSEYAKKTNQSVRIRAYGVSGKLLPDVEQKTFGFFLSLKDISHRNKILNLSERDAANSLYFGKPLVECFRILYLFYFLETSHLILNGVYVHDELFEDKRNAIKFQNELAKQISFFAGHKITFPDAFECRQTVRGKAMFSFDHLSEFFYMEIACQEKFENLGESLTQIKVYAVKGDTSHKLPMFPQTKRSIFDTLLATNLFWSKGGQQYQRTKDVLQYSCQTRKETWVRALHKILTSNCEICQFSALQSGFEIRFDRKDQVWFPLTFIQWKDNLWKFYTATQNYQAMVEKFSTNRRRRASYRKKENSGKSSGSKSEDVQEEKQICHKIEEQKT